MQSKTVVVKEDQARFEIWASDDVMVKSNADIYQVLEHIERALEDTELGFGIILQEALDGETFLVYMHSENQEGHLTPEQLAACEAHDFTNSIDNTASEAILNYLGLKIVFTHFVEDREEVQFQKGFLYVNESESKQHAYICVSDGSLYVYQSENGIAALTTNAYADSSMYIDIEDDKVRFEYSQDRVDALNEIMGGNSYEETIEKLAEYLILFKDTLMATQFARTTLSDAEVKECTDAIFESQDYKKLNLDSEEGKQKLYDLQYKEFQKRDETFFIPFAVDDPSWTPELVYNVSVKILKPIKFNNHYAQETFGPAYKGEVGEVILMSSEHYPYFQHNGFVEYEYETLSGKAVSGAQMTLDGFTKCEDDSLWSLVIDKIDNTIIAMDKEKVPHLFSRAGNDWFFYWKPLLQKGDKVTVSTFFGNVAAEVVVEETNFKNGMPFIFYSHEEKQYWAYLSQITSIVAMVDKE